MSLRVCSEPGCPVLCATTGRCSQHAKAADKARGSRQQRGYDAAHDRQRRRWSQRLPYPCARCGEPILVGDLWDLGHSDDRLTWTGPEHQFCNRSAAGKSAHPH